jgi:putative membrane protein insertion efficiency factor
VPLPACLLRTRLRYSTAVVILLICPLPASAAVRGGDANLGPAGMAIRFYQRYISDLRYGRCYFTPSCSQYAFEVIEERGFLLGTALTADRLIRCNGSAHRFHSQGPDGRLSDPATYGPALKTHPEVPSWLMPPYDEPPPLPEIAPDTCYRAEPGKSPANLTEYAGFADALAEMGDCERATTEYQRVAYLGETPELRFWALMRIGNCLYSNKAWAAAASEFRAAAAFGRSSRERNHARFMAAGSAFNALDYEQCNRIVDMLDFSRGPERATCVDADDTGARVTREHELFLSGLSFMAIEDWEGAAERFERALKECPDSPNRERAAILAGRARAGHDLPHRSPTAASVFSTILPGTGQMYAGRFTDGARHLIFNGLLIYTIYWLVQEENYTGAYLVGGITLPFYVGNIVGAGRSAEWFNSAKRAEFIRDAVADSE